MTKFVSYSKLFLYNMLNQAWNSNFTALASAPKHLVIPTVCILIFDRKSPFCILQSSCGSSGLVFPLSCSSLLCYPQAMKGSLFPMDWMCSMSFRWVSLPNLCLEPSSAVSLLLSPSALTEGGMFGAPVQCRWLEYFILLSIPCFFN